MSRLRFRPRRDVVCREAVELVADYLEDAMSQAQRRRLEAHLAHCPDCPEYLAQMRAIVALAGRVTPDDLHGVAARERAGGKDEVSTLECAVAESGAFGKLGRFGEHVSHVGIVGE